MVKRIRLAVAIKDGKQDERSDEADADLEGQRATDERLWREGGEEKAPVER